MRNRQNRRDGEANDRDAGRNAGNDECDERSAEGFDGSFSQIDGEK